MASTHKTATPLKSALPPILVKDYLPQVYENGMHTYTTQIYEHPIYPAIRAGNLAEVKKLVLTLPDINAVYMTGESKKVARPNALFQAASCEQLAIVKFLLKSGANLHHLNIHKQSILLYSVTESRPNKTFEYLLKEGADIFMPKSKHPCWLWENVVYLHNNKARAYYLKLLVERCSKEEIIEVQQYLNGNKSSKPYRAQIEEAKKYLNATRIELERQELDNLMPNARSQCSADKSISKI